MKDQLIDQVKEVVSASVSAGVALDSMPDSFPLAGNVLDSMAVTGLILALEDYFDFTFDDEELHAEAFETVQSLCQLVETKLNGSI